MAWATVHYFSNALEKQSAFQVVFPDDPNLRPPWAVYYLLHGLSDDATIWMRRTSIERYATGLPLVVVMPDGGRGWYTNAVEGEAYEDDLIRSVIGLVERTFPVRAERSGRAIGGLSMGGFGAVKLGLKHPDLFASVNSHSGALAALRDPMMMAERFGARAYARLFGPCPTGGPDDPFALAERIDHTQLPALRLDCGTDDFLIGQNRAFHAHLKALDIPHEYQEFPGSHNWDYWDTHVQEALRFHARNLGLT